MQEAHFPSHSKYMLYCSGWGTHHPDLKPDLDGGLLWVPPLLSWDLGRGYPHPDLGWKYPNSGLDGGP